MSISQESKEKASRKEKFKKIYRREEGSNYRGDAEGNEERKHLEGISLEQIEEDAVSVRNSPRFK